VHRYLLNNAVYKHGIVFVFISAKLKLVDQLNIFQQIGDKSEDVYFIFDSNSNEFSYLSPGFQSLWEITEDDAPINADLLLNTIHPEDKNYVMDCYANTLAAKREQQFEFRIIASGNEKYVHVSANALNHNDKNILAGVARDISALRRNIYYAEKINARKNSTLIILAHDLKEPISVINMMASAIEPGVKNDEKAQQFVQVIKDLCKSNIDLINSLLKQEFLESPEVELHKERIDIIWALSDVIENYKKSANVLGKQFVFTSSVEKLHIKVDNLKLMQVFNNLLSNAIKFTPDDGIIELNILDKRAAILITVRDNGIGIPEGMQPFLFDKFTRARRVGLKGEETTGLGLSIIKSLIELHKGKIWFESKENKGSTFFIEIPKIL
jgi:two-component system sensor histidine kinase VicK